VRAWEIRKDRGPAIRRIAPFSARHGMGSIRFKAATFAG